jgi:hypothetical protein
LKANHGARAQDASFNITLERDFAPGLAPMELAPQELTRAFLNLFGNGFYATTKRQRDGARSDFWARRSRSGLHEKGLSSLRPIQADVGDTWFDHRQQSADQLADKRGLRSPEQAAGVGANPHLSA